VTTLAVLEQRDGVLRKISHEVVTAAQRLGGGVEAVVCAAGAVQGADQAGKYGADKIVTLTNPAFAKYAPEACAQALADRAKQGGYRTIVFAASATGKDLAPRVAAKLGVAVAADITDLAVDGGGVVVTRPVYAGTALLLRRYLLAVTYRRRGENVDALRWLDEVDKSKGENSVIDDAAKKVRASIEAERAQLKKAGFRLHADCQPSVPLAVDLVQKHFPLDNFTAQKCCPRIIDIHALCQWVSE